jgi:hypothetical protein
VQLREAEEREVSQKGLYDKMFCALNADEMLPHIVKQTSHTSLNTSMTGREAIDGMQK